MNTDHRRVGRPTRTPYVTPSSTEERRYTAILKVGDTVIHTTSPLKERQSAVSICEYWMAELDSTHSVVIREESRCGE